MQVSAGLRGACGARPASPSIAGSSARLSASPVLPPRTASESGPGLEPRKCSRRRQGWGRGRLGGAAPAGCRGRSWPGEHLHPPSSPLAAPRARAVQPQRRGARPGDRPWAPPPPALQLRRWSRRCSGPRGRTVLALLTQTRCGAVWPGAPLCSTKGP